VKRASTVLVIAGLVAAPACDRERTKRYEALGKELHSPVAYLCRVRDDRKEGGGCNGECQTRAAAIRGYETDQAAKKLVGIAPFADPGTEARLAKVRELAAMVEAAVAGVCQKKADPSAPPTPEVTTCAEAARRAPIFELLDAVSDLGDDAKKRAGVALPVPRDEWCVVKR
jgi:hypothetical protein